MAMGRKGPTQPPLWIPHGAVSKAPGHTFYEKLNGLLEAHGFDAYVEGLCERFYAADPKLGRPSIAPGRYFRMLLIGYFEGIESERGICWRCADSLSLRNFLGLLVTDEVPDHSTLSRTRTRLAAEVYQEVFRFVLSIVERSGLLKGRVTGVDSTYLRADASMKAIVHRSTGEEYAEYLKSLARAAGIAEPTAEDARRIDRKRKKRTSNKEWESSTDSDARITRLKDGRTRLAYKPEHVVDLETGAILAAEVHPGDAADTTTVIESLEAARENVEAAIEISTAIEHVEDDEDDRDDPPPRTPGGSTNEPRVGVVGDKGYHSARVIVELEKHGFQPFIAERQQKGRRHWADKGGLAVARAVYRNRDRCARKKGRGLHRLRGEMVERPFAHICETGGARRTRLRGRENVSKRYLLQVAAANLGLVMRSLFGRGTPRGFWERTRRDGARIGTGLIAGVLSTVLLVSQLVAMLWEDAVISHLRRSWYRPRSAGQPSRLRVFEVAALSPGS